MKRKKTRKASQFRASRFFKIQTGVMRTILVSSYICRYISPQYFFFQSILDCDDKPRILKTMIFLYSTHLVQFSPNFIILRVTGACFSFFFRFLYFFPPLQFSRGHLDQMRTDFFQEIAHTEGWNIFVGYQDK